MLDELWTGGHEAGTICPAMSDPEGGMSLPLSPVSPHLTGDS